MEYIIVIRNEHGEILDSFTSHVNPIGAMSVTTKNGFFNICETSIDYTEKDTIILYSDNYDLFD